MSRMGVRGGCRSPDDAQTGWCLLPAGHTGLHSDPEETAMGYTRDEDPTRWARWWIALWAIVAGVLLVSAFLVPFRVWSLATAAGFGSMESVGLLRRRDPYPPLTYVLRRFVPRWLTFTAIYAYAGAVGGYWFGWPHPWRLAALLGLLGWLTTHFDVTYEGS